MLVEAVIPCVDPIDALVGRTSPASCPRHAFDLSDLLMLGTPDGKTTHCRSIAALEERALHESSTANKVRPNGRQVISEHAPLLLHESLNLKHNDLAKKGCAHRWPSSLRSSLVFSEPFDIVTSA
jgi:hypothetical protein